MADERLKNPDGRGNNIGNGARSSSPSASPFSDRLALDPGVGTVMAVTPNLLCSQQKTRDQCASPGEARRAVDGPAEQFPVPS